MKTLATEHAEPRRIFQIKYQIGRAKFQICHLIFHFIKSDINKFAEFVIPAKAGIQKTDWTSGQARNDRPYEIDIDMRRDFGRHA
jgi:hypothetical protein